MKDTKTNAGSFTAAKLKAKRRSLLAIIAITMIAVTVFSFTACNKILAAAAKKAVELATGGASGTTADGGGDGADGTAKDGSTQDAGITTDGSSQDSGTITGGSVDNMTWTLVEDNPLLGKKNDMGANNHIYAIAYGGGMFVAVGNNKAWSTDGVTWTIATDRGITSNDIAYGNGKFVAVGFGGTMEYSDDGKTWTYITSTAALFDNKIGAIAYGGGKFVAGGSSTKMAYSEDGINWTAVNDTSMFNTILHDGTTLANGIVAIAYGNGKFVAGATNGKNAYSTDGINWTAIEDESQTDSIAFGDGKFVKGYSTHKWYSTDGITWTYAERTKSSSNSIAYSSDSNAGKFVAGYSGMATSSDGVTWKEVADSKFGTSSIWAIAYGNGRFVAGGEDGRIAYSSGN